MLEKQFARRSGPLWMAFKWAAVPIALGVVWVAYQEAQQQFQRRLSVCIGGESPEPWAVTMVRRLPTRIVSRMLGHVADKPVPVWLRQPLYGAYAWAFGCALHEMEAPSLAVFPTFNDFFARSLAPGLRPIDPAVLVSPVDAHVLSVGPVDGDTVEQIKGIYYSLSGLLGPGLSFTPKPGHTLQHITLYLSPGNYHRWHSPTGWTVTERRHFPGSLLPVSPHAAKRIPSLFNGNERVVLLGDWVHGRFIFVAVGATNVGSISVHFDEGVTTNRAGEPLDGSSYDHRYEEGVPLTSGTEMGAFRMGSTVILILEAPESFDFIVETGETVRLGQAIGHLPHTPS